MTADPRYPIGPAPQLEAVTPARLAQAVATLERLPETLRACVSGLSTLQLDTPYREGGWTLRQVVHHVADSHLNAYVRCKLALTEEQPVIKPYQEAQWATLPDSALLPEVSLALLEALHARWAALLSNLIPAQWRREFIHPESGATSLQAAALTYAWHGQHHAAHIRQLREARGW